MTRTWLSLLAVVVTACGGGGGAAHQDAGLPADAPAGPPDASCFTNPTTHFQIINACTTAQKIYKDSHPAFELPDGGLPPLPN